MSLTYETTYKNKGITEGKVERLRYGGGHPSYLQTPDRACRNK